MFKNPSGTPRLGHIYVILAELSKGSRNIGSLVDLLTRHNSMAPNTVYKVVEFMKRHAFVEIEEKRPQSGRKPMKIVKITEKGRRLLELLKEDNGGEE